MILEKDMTARVLNAANCLAKDAPGQWDEIKHPRGAHGRFGSGTASPAPSSPLATAGKVAAGVVGAAALAYTAPLAVLYGARYMAAHPNAISGLKSRVSEAYAKVRDSVSTTAQSSAHWAKAKADVAGSANRFKRGSGAGRSSPGEFTSSAAPGTPRQAPTEFPTH